MCVRVFDSQKIGYYRRYVQETGKVHRRFSLTWLALHHHSWNWKTSSSFIQHVLRPSLPAVGRHRTSKSLNHVDRKVHMQFNRGVNCFHVESTRFEQLQWAIASITVMMPSRNSSYPIAQFFLTTNKSSVPHRYSVRPSSKEGQMFGGLMENACIQEAMETLCVRHPHFPPKYNFLLVVTIQAH